MNKKIFTGILLILMLASMMLTAGCSAKADPASDEAALRIAELEQKNAELQAEVDALTAEIDRMKQKAALQDWSMDVQAWADGNGATVTFTASPISYVDGQRAALSVRMGDLEAESTNCVWDGSVYTGSVELSAADGYSYYCVLINADGSQSEVALNTPDNMTDEALVNLGSSLSAYANLVVESWEATASSLNIDSGYMQAQMPRLSFNGNAPEISAAALVLKLNDAEVSRQEVVLSAGEGQGSYESAIEDCSFAMPAMEEDYQLDLWLEVTMNNGNVISVAGGSWYSSDGTLQMVVG